MRRSYGCAALGCVLGFADATALGWNADRPRWVPARETPPSYMSMLGMDPPGPTTPPTAADSKRRLGARDPERNTCAYVDGISESSLRCPDTGRCVYNSLNSFIGCCHDDAASCPLFTTCYDATESARFTTDNGFTLYCGGTSYPHCITHLYQDAVFTGYTLLGCAISRSTASVWYRPLPVTTTTTSTSPSPSSSSSSSSSTSTSPTPSSTSTSDPDPDPDPPTPVGAIIGGVVGGLGAIALVLFVIWIMLRYHRKQQATAATAGVTGHHQQHQQHQQHQHQQQNPPPPPPMSYLPRDPGAQQQGVYYDPAAVAKLPTTTSGYALEQGLSELGPPSPSPSPGPGPMVGGGGGGGGGGGSGGGQFAVLGAGVGYGAGPGQNQLQGRGQNPGDVSPGTAVTGSPGGYYHPFQPSQQQQQQHQQQHQGLGQGGYGAGYQGPGGQGLGVASELSVQRGDRELRELQG